MNRILIVGLLAISPFFAGCETGEPPPRGGELKLERGRIIGDGNDSVGESVADPPPPPPPR